MDKIKCGSIFLNGQSYEVEWDPKSKDVWVIDNKGYKKQFGQAKAKNKESAKECALDMLKGAGY